MVTDTDLIKDDIVKESQTFHTILTKFENTNENYGPLHLVSRIGGLCIYWLSILIILFYFKAQKSSQFLYFQTEIPRIGPKMDLLSINFVFENLKGFCTKSS